MKFNKVVLGLAALTLVMGLTTACGSAQEQEKEPAEQVQQEENVEVVEETTEGESEENSEAEVEEVDADPDSEGVTEDESVEGEDAEATETEEPSDDVVTDADESTPLDEAQEAVDAVAEQLGTISHQVLLDYNQKVVTAGQVTSAVDNFEGKPQYILIIELDGQAPQALDSKDLVPEDAKFHASYELDEEQGIVTIHFKQVN